MNLHELSKTVHAANEKWWQDPATGLPIKRNKGELIALIHSELSECYDGEIGGLMDDKLPHRKMGEVEIVDAFIRTLDYSAGFGHDIQYAGFVIGIVEFPDLNHLVGGVFNRSDIPLMPRIHSSLSKILEAERKSRFDEVPILIVEFIIELALYARFRGYDLQGSYDEKMAYNATREDHKHEARLIAGGKQF